MSRLLGRLRQAVREGHYRISAHAHEEMDDDQLDAVDIENGILTGQIVRRLTDDPRGPRLEVAGEARDGRATRVVCRYIESGILRIITAYVTKE